MKSAKKKAQPFAELNFSPKQTHYILSNPKLGAETVMHDFASRFSPVVASRLLHQLFLHGQGKVYDTVDNQPQLDEFYVAMNELLMAVFHFAEELKLEHAEMPEEES